jgi:hypothetical protein
MPPHPPAGLLARSGQRCYRLTLAKSPERTFAVVAEEFAGTPDCDGFDDGQRIGSRPVGSRAIAGRRVGRGRQETEIRWPATSLFAQQLQLIARSATRRRPRPTRRCTGARKLSGPKPPVISRLQRFHRKTYAPPIPHRHADNALEAFAIEHPERRQVLGSPPDRNLILLIEVYPVGERNSVQR